MRWNSPRSLGKTIEAKAANRPVKIAYLVPFDNSPQTQMILDAIFFESYTRWAGMYTLVIPSGIRAFWMIDTLTGLRAMTLTLSTLTWISTPLWLTGLPAFAVPWRF